APTCHPVRFRARSGLTVSIPTRRGWSERPSRPILAAVASGQPVNAEEIRSGRHEATVFSGTRAFAEHLSSQGMKKRLREGADRGDDEEENSFLAAVERNARSHWRCHLCTLERGANGPAVGLLAQAVELAPPPDDAAARSSNTLAPVSGNAHHRTSGGRLIR